MKKQPRIEYVRDFELWDRDHFTIVKGIATVAMLTAYLCGILFGFRYSFLIRIMAAALFLFCSGYGLSESFRIKGSLVHFWENRAIKVWIPSLVTLILFDLIDIRPTGQWMIENPLAIKDGFMYVLFGGYAVFWLLFYFVEVEVTRIVGLFLAAVIAFFCLDQQSLRVILLAFPTGVMVSQIKAKYTIRKMKRAGKTVLTLLFTALAAGGWILAMNLPAGYAQNAVWALTMTCGAIGVTLLVYLLKSISVWGIFAPAGMISYAVYLMYEEWIALLMKDHETETVALTLLVLLVAASLFTWLRKLLIDGNKKMRRRRKSHLKGMM